MRSALRESNGPLVSSDVVTKVHAEVATALCCFNIHGGNRDR